MTDNSIGVVKTFYEALAVGNMEALFAGFAPVIDWREADGFPYADGNPYTTPAAVAEGVLARIVADWDGFAVNVDRYVGDGDRVVMLGRYSGTYRATGKTLDVPVAHAWTVKEGQIVAFQQYVDTLLVERATR